MPMPTLAHDIVRKASQLSGNRIGDSHDTPASIPRNPPLECVPRNILAFRTITQLLSHIQQNRAFQVTTPYVQASDTQRLELKLTNAFSTVAVIEYEVVGVVARRLSTTLEVVACIQPSEAENPPTLSNSLSNHMNGFQDLIFTQNTRQDDSPATISTEPIITDARILANVKLDDDEATKRYAEACWSRPTLARHLWVMSKLLTIKEPTVDPREREHLLSQCIQLYIAATCYPKIRHRLRNKAVSQRYIDSLKVIKEMETIRFDGSMHDQPTRQEIANDQQFMVNYFLPTQGLPDVKQYPYLCEQAKLVGDKDFQLYTEGTRAEFHALLLDLIDQYSQALDELHKNRGTETAPTEGTDKFKQKVGLVMVSAYALQRLATGAAIRMHLKIIAHTLRKWNHLQISTSTSGEEQEELDEDLKAVQPFTRTEENVEIPLWTSYVDWLRLMTSHFDAVEILVKFVTGPQFHHKAISIHIVVAPLPDKQLLKWQQLFTEPTLFPTSSIADTPLASNTNKPHVNITNASILAFLNKAPETSSMAKEAKMAWNNKDIRLTIKCFEKLKSSNWLGWEDCTKETLVMLNQLNGQLPNNDLSKEITGDIESLIESTKFFTYLDENQPFLGTLHCEACLASLLVSPPTHSTDISAMMEDFGPIIGISKCCCPVCRQLLFILGKRQTQHFIIRGSHNMVTACSLPTWLPPHIVDTMNEFFGLQLRQELVQLIDSPTLLQNRALSTGSQRLSSDSTEWPNQYSKPLSVDFLQQVLMPE